MFNPLLFFEAGRQHEYFSMTVDTSLVGITTQNQFRIILAAGYFEPFNVDWGDGTIDYIGAYNDIKLTHNYLMPGVYNIKMVARTVSVYYLGSTEAAKILKINNYGNLLLFNGQFRGASNMTVNNAIGRPKSPAYSFTISSYFQGCSSLTKVAGISSWDVSNCNNMILMFYGAYNFDDDISGWDVSNVLAMSQMFRACTAFNRDISSWKFNKDVALDGFMLGKTSADYNPIFYDNLLQKFSTIFIGTGRTRAKTLGMGTIKYTAAGKPYRDALVADGWTITDGGQI